MEGLGLWKKCAVDLAEDPSWKPHERTLLGNLIAELNKDKTPNQSGRM